MHAVAKILGEEVSRVDFAGNVSNANGAYGMFFADTGFAEVDVFGAFVCNGRRPVDASFVVVEDGDGLGGVGHGKIGRAVDNADEVRDAGVGCDNLRFARAESSLLLANSFPGDGATAAADDKPAERAELEKFDVSAGGDGFSKLAPPACVTEGNEFVAFSNRGGSSVGVCLLVMMVGKMVECLKCLFAVGMVAEAILGGAVEVLDGVDGRFVVLFAGRSAITGEEGVDWGDIRSGACCEPVDATNNTLVDLGAAREIGVVGGGGGDQVDGEPRAIGSHVGHAGHLVHAESVSNILDEGGLREMDGEVSVVMAQPGEGCAKEEIDTDHKVDCELCR